MTRAPKPRWSTLWLMALLACSAPSSVEPVVPEWVVSEVDGRRFSHPADWALQLPRGESVGGPPRIKAVLYLTTVDIGPECIEIRPNEFQCGANIPPLGDGDIVVSWDRHAGRGASVGGGGQLMVVDAFEARFWLLRAADVGCLGADTSAMVGIQTGPRSLEVITLCSRGLDPGSVIGTFRRFVASIDLALFD